MNKKKNLIIVIICAVVLIAGAVVCFAFLKGGNKIEEKATTTTEVPTTTANEHIGQKLSYLTGEYIDEKQANKRPVAVMYNNIINAMPHSGISNASVLYEAPVEGCITRIMAIFDNYSKLKKIGSVRSCRIYYAYLALEWDAIYCHYGQSKYALNFLKSDKIDNICAFNDESAYYRTADRVAPHNCFTSGKGINKAIKTLKYKTKHKSSYNGNFNFAKEGQTVNLSSEKVAKKVELGYQINEPWFTYNEKTGFYYRYQYGKKHIDDQNKKQLSCSNIIIQFVDYKMFPDKKSLNIKQTGTGKGWYITKGKAEKITWEKEDKMGQTVYKDVTGNPITINTGKTWICIVQNQYKSRVKISDGQTKKSSTDNTTKKQ